jgi:hypothetical protein
MRCVAGWQTRRRPNPSRLVDVAHRDHAKLVGMLSVTLDDVTAPDAAADDRNGPDAAVL